MNKINKNDELVALYLSECSQLLERFEKIVFDTGKRGELADAPEMFRLLHTIKGSSAMLDYTPLSECAHSFENILSVLKNVGSRLNEDEIQALVDVGLNFVAYFQRQLKNVQGGTAPEQNDALNNEINALAQKLGAQKKTPSLHRRKTDAATETIEKKDGEMRVSVTLKDCAMPHIRAFIVAKSILKLCTFMATSPENLENEKKYDDIIKAQGYEIRFVPNQPDTAGEIIKKISSQPFVNTCVLKKSSSEPADDFSVPENITLPQSVTVPQPVINTLISYMGEIANAQSALEEYIDESKLQSRQLYNRLSALRHAVADAEVLTSSLGTHDVGSVFMQMHRAVRSMAKILQKDIKFKTFGDDEKVDKSVLELLADSLIHIVRNAVDHGIEFPAARRERGKPQSGTVTLSAVKKNGYLTVTVADDGAGIDTAAVLDKAERMGRLTKPKNKYSDSEVYRLLMLPGLSTNAGVTQYSGRGVGLDTVVRRVKQIGGSVLVESKKGEGTAFCLSIPITLVIIDGIGVSIDGENELIVPANAVMHIRRQTGKCGAVADYGGESYRELAFPGQKTDEKQQSSYLLFFAPSFGNYFIRAEKVNMMSTYYVKKLPKYVSDALGDGYIYSGCVAGGDSKLRCVLDAARLAELSGGRTSERHINL